MATKQEKSNIIAVIALSGKQYLVREGDKVEAEKLDLPEGEKVTLKEVLLTFDGEATKVGTPFVDGASVELKLEKTAKGEKVDIRKYKAKSRYRRTTGHRQTKSTLVVTGINLK